MPTMKQNFLNRCALLSAHAYVFAKAPHSDYDALHRWFVTRYNTHKPAQ